MPPRYRGALWRKEHFPSFLGCLPSGSVPCDVLLFPPTSFLFSLASRGSLKGVFFFPSQKLRGCFWASWQCWDEHLVKGYLLLISFAPGSSWTPFWGSGAPKGVPALSASPFALGPLTAWQGGAGRHFVDHVVQLTHLTDEETEGGKSESGLEATSSDSEFNALPNQTLPLMTPLYF